MSFIKNMFGGGAAPKKPDPVQQKRIESERNNFEKEKAKEKLEDAIKKSEAQIDKLNHDITTLETEVKSLIMQKRKDKAAVVLKKIKAKKEILTRTMNQATFIEKQKNMMDETEQDMDMLDTIKAANSINQKNRDQQEVLADELMKAKELESEAKQRRDEMNDLLAGDDEDEDDLNDMMKEYEQEAAAEMQMGFNKADKNIITGDKTKPQTQPAQQQQSKQKESNFDSLMADLMN